MNIFEENHTKMFLKSILTLKTEEEVMAFLEDIMTTKEILDISQRLAVAKMLREKEVYSKISKETGASSATISRVNRCCLYGAGGYKTVLDRLDNLEDK
ncbi:MAG: DNA-binding transcriptional regulator [Ruminococcaceae bacterium]|nr:DNA-binding transcriptional regulator [Oscillospiraceae bacterium]